MYSSELYEVFWFILSFRNCSLQMAPNIWLLPGTYHDGTPRSALYKEKAETFFPSCIYLRCVWVPVHFVVCVQAAISILYCRQAKCQYISVRRRRLSGGSGMLAIAVGTIKVVASFASFVPSFTTLLL